MYIALIKVTLSEESYKVFETLGRFILFKNKTSQVTKPKVSTQVGSTRPTQIH